MAKILFESIPRDYGEEPPSLKYISHRGDDRACEPSSGMPRHRDESATDEGTPRASAVSEETPAGPGMGKKSAGASGAGAVSGADAKTTADGGVRSRSRRGGKGAAKRKASRRSAPKKNHPAQCATDDAARTMDADIKDLFRRPIESLRAQCAHLLELGVSFDRVSLHDARDFMEHNTYYYRILPFIQNFDKLDTDEGRRHCDFGTLVDISNIDYALRRTVEDLSAGIEYAMRVRYYFLFMRFLCVASGSSPNRGGDWADAMEETRSRDLWKKRGLSPFTQWFDSQDEDSGAVAIWQRWEMASFADLIKVYRNLVRVGHFTDHFVKVLDAVRILRNAAAHHNPLLVPNPLGSNDCMGTIDEWLLHPLHLMLSGMMMQPVDDIESICRAAKGHGDAEEVRAAVPRADARDDAMEMFDSDCAVFYVGCMMLAYTNFVRSAGMLNAAVSAVDEFDKRILLKADLYCDSACSCPRLLKQLNALHALSRSFVRFNEVRYSRQGSGRHRHSVAVKRKCVVLPAASQIMDSLATDDPWDADDLQRSQAAWKALYPHIHDLPLTEAKKLKALCADDALCADGTENGEGANDVASRARHAYGAWMLLALPQRHARHRPRNARKLHEASATQPGADAASGAVEAVSGSAAQAAPADRSTGEDASRVSVRHATTRRRRVRRRISDDETGNSRR